MTDAALKVLVVDDDDVTSEIVERSLKKRGASFHVVPARDGLEALNLLRGESGPQLGRPYVVLLDLNMPRMNGFEFLENLRADPVLRDSIVFVLTTSDTDSDRARAYNELIAGYMVKSAIGPQFVKLAALLAEYGSAITLP